MQNSELGQGDRTPGNSWDEPPQDFDMKEEGENMNREQSLQIEDTHNQEAEQSTYRYENLEKNGAEQAPQEEFENSFDIENYEQNQEFVYAQNELEQNCFQEEQIESNSGILQQNQVQIGKQSQQQEQFSPVFNELHHELEIHEPEEQFKDKSIDLIMSHARHQFDNLNPNQQQSQNTKEGEHDDLKEYEKPQDLFEPQNPTFEGQIQKEFIEKEQSKQGQELQQNKKQQIHSVIYAQKQLIKVVKKQHTVIEEPLKVQKSDDQKQDGDLNQVQQQDKKINEKQKKNEEVVENQEIKRTEVKKTEALKREEITRPVYIQERKSEEKKDQDNKQKQKIKEAKTEKKQKEGSSKTKTKQKKKQKLTNQDKKQKKSDKKMDDKQTLPIIAPIKKNEKQEQQAEEKMEKAQVSTAIDIQPRSPKDGGNSTNPHPSEQGGVDTDPTLSIIPVIIIKEAQKERISSILDQFEEYIERHRAYIVHQKRTIANVQNEIESRKQKKYVWYHYIREYFLQFHDLTTQFHDVSYKVSKQSAASNQNEFLNMNKYFGEGVHDLSFLKRQTGNQYMNLGSLVSGQLSLALESVFNKFISEIKRVQSDMLKKKQEFTQKQDILRKRIEKNTKIYTRGRLGKKISEDVFVETCMFIEAQKHFRKALIHWGVGLKELRQTFIALEQKLNNEIQTVVNSFKKASSSMYSFHPQSFEKIISSKQQIIKSTHFSDLCSLIDSDYIKYTYETATKTVISQVSDKQFEAFMEMPHFEEIVGKSSDLLKGVINKSIHLKAEGEQLVNTISGNLVLFNSINSEYKDKFVVKNLSATIVGNGLIQFDEIVPGFIFNDTRTMRLEFKDQDRAEELICLLNEIE